MAAQTLPDPPPHKSSPGKTNTYMILEAEFGDGYEQVVADGIHNVREQWALTWTNEDLTDVNTLTSFFDSLAGAVPFFWTPPGEGTPKLWRARDGYTLSNVSGFSSTLNVVFKRWFGEEPA